MRDRLESWTFRIYVVLHCLWKMRTGHSALSALVMGNVTNKHRSKCYEEEVRIFEHEPTFTLIELL
jgi:hypothetical protein